MIFGLLSVMLFSCEDETLWQEDASIEGHSMFIVGGAEAWMESAIALRTSQCDPSGPNDLICSGLLISPTAVLTASHCVDLAVTSGACPNGIDPSQWTTFRVAVGCHNALNCPASNWKPLASAPVTHPDYDIAILKLASPVTNVQSRRLATPARQSEVKAGDWVTLYGYGLTAETGYTSDVLRSVERPISTIPLERIGIMHPTPHLFDTLCESNPYIGANHGDSGGPTLVYRDGEWFSLGVMNGGGYGSAQTDHILVPYFYNWIESNVSDLPRQYLLPSAQIGSANAAMLATII